MNDFLTVLNKKYNNKYDYIRVKSVIIFKQNKNINITLYIPEDIFDYEFENEDIKAIQEVAENTINCDIDKTKYKIKLIFEKIYYDVETLKGATADFIKANYPYIGANTDFEKMTTQLDKDIDITFVMQNSVLDYLKKSDFEKALKIFYTDRFCLDATINYETVEDIEISLNDEQSGYRSIFIPISDVKKFCGKDNLKGVSPKHIDVINKTGDNITICGRMEIVERKIWDENKAVKDKKFYKYHYIIDIDDTSAKMRVLYNTNEEECPLDTLIPGSEVVVRGRVFYRVDSGVYIMFAKGIGTCKIDFDTVKAQLAPLPPPDEYKINPVKYENLSGGYQIELDIFDKADKPVDTGEAVALHYLSIPKANDEIIYEIACINIKNGVLTDCYHTYVKAPKNDNMSLTAKAKIVTAPRITTVIPDLIKYTYGKTIVAIDVFGVLKKLNEIAKPLRYVFHNELKEIKKYGNKSKAENFITICKDNGIKITQAATAFEYAEAIGKLYIKNYKS